MWLKRATIALAVLSMGAVTAACGEDQKTGADQKDELVIGTLQPITGPASSFGTGMVETMTIVFDQINESGGVKIDGKEYRLKLKAFDDENKPERAQKVARDAMNDGIRVMIGPFGTATTEGAYSIIANSDAFWLSSTANSPGLTRSENVYRTAMQIDQVDGAMIRFLEEHPDIKRVAMTTDQAHKGLADRTSDFVKDIEALGREVVVNAKHQPGDSDFRPTVTKMKSADAEVYVFRGYANEQIQYFKQVRELTGDDTWLLGPHAISTAEMRKAFPDESLLKNTIGAGPRSGLDTFVAAGNKLASDLETKLGEDPFGYAVLAHDSVQILIEGLSRSSDLTAKSIMRAMDELQAADVKGKTIDEFLPWDDGSLFKNREIKLTAEYMTWSPGVGWKAS